MTAIAYIQLVPKLNRSGQLIGLAAKTISQSMPRIVRDGAHLVRVEFKVPDEAFRPTRVSVEIPIEKLVAAVEAKVQ